LAPVVLVVQQQLVRRQQDQTDLPEAEPLLGLCVVLVAVVLEQVDSSTSPLAAGAVVESDLQTSPRATTRAVRLQVQPMPVPAVQGSQVLLAAATQEIRLGLAVLGARRLESLELLETLVGKGLAAVGVAESHLVVAPTTARAVVFV
jgi:hypothetical protein